jgi:hypothetical protein
MQASVVPMSGHVTSVPKNWWWNVIGRELNSSPSSGSGNEATGAAAASSKTPKFSKKQLACAFAVAGISDALGAFVSPAPPLAWLVDLGTAVLLFMVLGWHWLLLPGLALEAIPGLGVLPFWLLVVGAIAVLGTPRPKLDQR